MKNSFFALLLAATSFVASAQNKMGQEPYLTKSFSNEAVKSVVAETSGGNITVTGGTASEARVEVYITGNNNRMGEGNLTKDEIQKRLDADYNLDVSVNNGTLTTKAKPKERNINWKRGLSISFKVIVPQAVSTDLTTSGGNIELSKISGEQKFRTSGGNLQLDQLSGNIRGTTSGGNIYVKNSKDKINLSTSGGNIEAADCTGNLTLSTSGGNLDLSKLNGDINATTSGGNVQADVIEGALRTHTSGGNVRLSDLACSVDASTSGGHMDVAIKELQKSIKISNSGGNINLQLPKGATADLSMQARKVNADKMDGFNGTIKDDEISGKLNGGGTSVTVDAGSGKVSLSFR